jgi:predicted RNase H-like HicB family nuclease
VKTAQRLTAIIEREDDGFVALCPDLDIASQGSSIEEARANLIEAITCGPAPMHSSVQTIVLAKLA